MFIGVFINFINTFAREFRYKLAFLLLLSLIAAGFEFLGLSLIYSFAILLSKNEISIPALSALNIQNSPKILLLLGLMVAFTYIFKDIFMILYIKFQNRLIAKITNKIFEKNYKLFIGQNYLLAKKISKSDKQRILGESINIIMNDFVGAVLSLIVNLTVAFGIILYLFIKFKTTAIIISAFIFAVWFIENKYFKTRAKKYGEELNIADREKQNFTLATIDSQKEVIIYDKKDDFSDVANKIQKQYTKCKSNMNTNRAMPMYFTEIGVMGTFVLFVVLQLVNNPDAGALGAGLAAIAAVVLRIVPTINKTQNCLYGINSSKYEAQWFLNTIKSLNIKNPQVEKNNTPLDFKDKIAFLGVNFCYEDNKKVLKNINFEIKKGEFVGITGLSGSGKTTLFNLICGLLEPTSGEIKIDNAALNNTNTKMWQNNISILSQEFSLPFKTIWQNVVLEPDESKVNNYDFEKIILALKNAGLGEQIYNNLEKNPSDLSCGQKHRVALSRTFYFERNIIMLDEATAALDVEAENEISKTLEQVKGTKTIIAIAHRIKTLKDCDKLIYIDNGEIVDTGTLEYLCEKHPPFKRLVDLSKF